MHAQIPLAVRIFAISEIVTGKGLTVPQTKIDPIQYGAVQHRARSAEEPLLHVCFGLTFPAFARSAAGTDIQQI